MNRKILASWIMCPDGTMIPSFNRHDYREHETVDTWKRVTLDGDPATKEPKNKISREWNEWNDNTKLIPNKIRHSMIDGGSDYLRRGGVFTEMTVYEDDPFEVIRRFLCRGSRGIDGDKPLTWVPLFAMSNNWLKAVIEYDPSNYYNKWYYMELDYREDNKIDIKYNI
jgi:hypothetical protein